MAKTFINRNNKAYYYNDIQEFIKDDADSIIGQLISKTFEVYDDAQKDQRDAWNYQIVELQRRLKEKGIYGDIIFEYDIVRMNKRIDVVLLIKHMVFSLEFKNGKKIFSAADAQQAEDYALDIKNFHKESENLFVCPILIATHAEPYEKKQVIDCYPDKQIYLQRENIDTLLPKINEIVDKYGDNEKIDRDKWINSPYHPTPTIIDAAVEAYQTHDISEIVKSEAGQDNIDKCVAKIKEIVCYAKENNKKCVAFLTGVPGAGKTLVGLDVVSKNLSEDKNNLSVYLSGNGPLVEVLREALKRSSKQKGINKRETSTSVEALIQSSFAFKKDNFSRTTPTPEKILIFDEAQRVWNKEKMMHKHRDENMNFSEPFLFYKIMDRQPDWAVMVCLVGLGQDIYDGEVGLNEWFRCGIEDYPNWEMFYSDEIFSQIEDKDIDIDAIKKCDRCKCIKELHLKTSVRSFRAEKQCEFVDALLNNEPAKACIFLKQIKKKYQVYVTRNYDTAKRWAKGKVRGSERCGVLASSSAQRLKPEGIYVPTNIDTVNWFLAPSNDLRSSNMMEVVASEFKTQGLEIDWGVICWDADLRRLDDGWDYFNFKGSKWTHRNKEEQQRYLLNSYRVLLTRCRQGMIIFVPKGCLDVDEPDLTRDPKFYDEIYKYLLSCGIEEKNDR